VSLTRWEIYYAVYLATLESRDAIRANWRGGIVTEIRACGVACGSLAKGMTKISYKGHRFPPEIIQQAIGLYLRFTLSFRVLVQAKRNKRAALKLMRKLLKKYGFVPDKLVTDDLKSYAAAIRDLRISNRHDGPFRDKVAGRGKEPIRPHRSFWPMD
jgi:transposase-like protein